MSTPNPKPVVEPYLFFEGRCEEALAFYEQALDAEVTFKMRFGDNPDAESCGNATPDKIMHANLRVGQTTVMVSDGNCAEAAAFSGFALSLAVKTEAEAERYFSALAEGGQVMMPLGKTFFSPSFGIVTDRFGVMWMVNVPGNVPQP